MSVKCLKSKGVSQMNRFIFRIHGIDSEVGCLLLFRRPKNIFGQKFESVIKFTAFGCDFNVSLRSKILFLVTTQKKGSI